MPRIGNAYSGHGFFQHYFCNEYAIQKSDKLPVMNENGREKIRMFINDLSGCIKCLNYKEYEQQIEKILCSSEDNEIELYIRESTDGWNIDYPCTLSILLKNKQAVVNYFSEGNKEMYVSLEDTDREDDFRWQIGANDYSVTGRQILSIKKALQCALQFFDSQEKPSCIEWEEL